MDLSFGRWSGTSPNTGKTYDDPALELIAAGDGAEPGFTVSGTARDVDAWLWNRPTTVDLTIDGDRDGLELFRQVIALGVQ